MQTARGATLSAIYGKLATEEWILEERQQMRSMCNEKLGHFHQCYVDDVSWLNEYMTELCETGPERRYVPQLLGSLFAC
jgi:hypothetical protein